jgi:hypothetical protein
MWSSAIAYITFAGRPFGDESFIDEMAQRFKRHWQSDTGRPSKRSLLRPHEKAAQFPLFSFDSDKK